MDNYFIELNRINVSGKTEKKGNLTYLSWPWAWGEVKKLHPDATYTIYENCDGLFYHTDGKTCWVKTGLTVNGIEHIEYLPVMDAKNKSIPLESVTSVDVNKTIQRSLTKAAARHGLGLYIYAGEDLPEEKPGEREPASGDAPVLCQKCGARFMDYWDGAELIKAEKRAERSKEMNGGALLCGKCTKEAQKAKNAETAGGQQ